MPSLHTRFLPALVVALAAMAVALAPQSAVAQDWPTASTPAFDALMAEARAEGELVILGDPLLSEEFSRQFERDTGIRVVFISGAQNDKKIRFLRETEALKATFDVFFAGTEALGPARAGLLAAIAPSLLLPEVTGAENWREGAIHYIDEGATYLPVPAQYVSGLLLVNTKEIDPARVTSWQDLLAPDLKGRIISHDPRVRGGGEVLAAFIAQVIGLDFFKTLFVGQEVALAADYRQVTDAVARGTYAVGLSALPRDIVKYQREGLDYLVAVAPSDQPGYLVGGSSVLAIPSSAPHPKAAMVFANWYLSKRGQEMYSGIYALPSDRTDVTGGPWPAFVVPQPGVSYFNQYAEAWVVGTVSEAAKKFLEILAK